MKYCIFDTETTGLDPKTCYVLSVGMVCIDEQRLQEYAAKINKPAEQGELILDDHDNFPISVDKEFEFHEYISWFNAIDNFSIPDETIKVHGLTNEFIKQNGGDPVIVFSNLAKFIRNIVGEDDLSLVAFNLPYDINMILSNLTKLAAKCDNADVRWLLDLFRRNTSVISNNVFLIDSLTLDRIMHFDHDGVKVRHNLEAVGERYGLAKDIHAHDALSDSKRTTLIWIEQLKELASFHISIDRSMEDRLNKAYLKNEERYKRKTTLSYFGDVY